MKRWTDLPLLWKKFKQNGDQAARGELIKAYLYLAKVTASKRLQQLRLPPNVQKEDLVSHAILGLIKAVDQFEPERGVKFATYAITMIKGAMLEFLRDDCWVPRSVRDKEKCIEAAERALVKATGRTPTDEEFAAYFGVDLKKWDRIKKESQAVALFSLECRVKSDGTQLRIEDTIDDDQNIFLAAATTCEKQWIARAVDSLPERERIIIALYYHEDWTFRAIGEVLKISESRVYQLHGQALKRLKMRMEEREE